jgi:hypothetical protein
MSERPGTLDIRRAYREIQRHGDRVLFDCGIADGGAVIEGENGRAGEPVRRAARKWVPLLVWLCTTLSVAGASSGDKPLSAMVPPGGVSRTAVIRRHGIEWHFDREPFTGTFANGDPWVVGPVRIVRTVPPYDGENHGWEVNPRVAGPQGFAADVGSFDPALVPSLPYRARPGESIVKTIRSAEEPSGPNCRGCLRVAAVLTVVDRIPPDSGRSVFRPPYVGAGKPSYRVEDLRVDLLPSLPRAFPAPTLVWMEEAFGKVQLDHKPGRLGRNVHPVENIPDYGADIARRNADGCLRLMLADPLETKMGALIAYVQYGIDLYHMVLDGHTWPGGGGHRPGQKLPLSFAAVMLDEPGMRRAVKEAAFFHEDQLVYHSEVTGQALFGTAKGHARARLEERYWEAVFSNANTGRVGGFKAYRDPYGFIDGGYEPGTGYQYCCISQPWKGEALACHLMPALKEVWDGPAFLEYVDRWVSFGTWAVPDPCAPVDTAWSLYGVTFGPDGRGGCIQDTDTTDGVGRFPGRHGAARNGGGRYSEFQAMMWDAYRETAGVPSQH